jgi:hypothetical protein
MTLSPEIRQKLTERLAALGEHVPVSLVGPDMRCATVEDAERLVARFEKWLVVFAELSADLSTNDNLADLTDTGLHDDRSSLVRLYNTFDKLVVDLETAIRATREEGISWEPTSRDFPAHTSVIAARKITGTGSIDPSIFIITAKEEHAIQVVHQVIVGLGGEGFRAICVCGWKSTTSWVRDDVAKAGSEHKQQSQLRGIS